MDIDKLKDIIQDSNVNFLFGSGMSASYLRTLGNIEILLTESNDILDDKVRKIVRVSLYKKYFDEIIEKNIQILEKHSDTLDLMRV